MPLRALMEPLNRESLTLPVASPSPGNENGSSADLLLGGS